MVAGAVQHLVEMLVARNSRRRLAGTFDEGDFFGRESIKFIRELIDLLVGGGNGV